MSWRDDSSSSDTRGAGSSRGSDGSQGGGSRGGGGGQGGQGGSKGGLSPGFTGQRSLGLTTGKVTGSSAYGPAGGNAVGMGAPGYENPAATARTLARLQPRVAPVRQAIAAPAVAPPVPIPVMKPPVPQVAPPVLGPNVGMINTLPQIGGTVPSQIQQGINFTTQGPTSMPGSPVGPQVGGVTTVAGVGGQRGSWATPSRPPNNTPTRTDVSGQRGSVTRSVRAPNNPPTRAGVGGERGSLTLSTRAPNRTPTGYGVGGARGSVTASTRPPNNTPAAPAAVDQSRVVRSLTIGKPFQGLPREQRSVNGPRAIPENPITANAPRTLAEYGPIDRTRNLLAKPYKDASRIPENPNHTVGRVWGGGDYRARSPDPSRRGYARGGNVERPSILEQIKARAKTKVTQKVTPKKTPWKKGATMKPAFAKGGAVEKFMARYPDFKLT